MPRQYVRDLKDIEGKVQELKQQLEPLGQREKQYFLDWQKEGVLGPMVAPPVDQKRENLVAELRQQEQRQSQLSFKLVYWLAQKAQPLWAIKTDSLLALCYAELLHCVERGLWVRRCGNCRTYFVTAPVTRRYCIRCQKKGAHQVYLENLKRKNPEKAELLREKELMYKRYQRGSYKGKLFALDDLNCWLKEHGFKPYKTRGEIKQETRLRQRALQEVPSVLAKLRKATASEISEETHLPFEKVLEVLKHLKKEGTARPLGDPRRNQWEVSAGALREGRR
ncbi:hypothetical protein HKBW3S25_00149 [Candidatus Hakubella thermalkaliphila]|uniref:Uncharacterized protein n=2 Tax=Candidatus Hakubella thermalkaliphila TaxID=2754717 RepID=A0A6V8NWS7_9ACTN|nr:hypothetical protein HKBW3S25_00149 [Candidatus Hakubella thermalkaliphila]